jgi:hypothetical protein
VRRALEHGVAAATILAARAVPPDRARPLRIAFDGDAVIFGDESERVSQEQGLAAFHDPRDHRAPANPWSGGPFPRLPRRPAIGCRPRFPAGEDAPIRTALVTARSAPAHERVIRTLREWDVRLDEALFLGGRPKGPVPGNLRRGHLLRRLAAQHRLGAPPRGHRARAARRVERTRSHRPGRISRRIRFRAGLTRATAR